MYMPQLKVSQFVRMLSWENKWYNPCVSVCIPCEKTKGTQYKAMNLKKWIVNREQIGRHTNPLRNGPTEILCYICGKNKRLWNKIKS